MLPILRLVNKIVSPLLTAVVLLAPISPAMAVQPFMPAPENLGLVPGVGVVTLSWNSGANGTGNEVLYEIQQSTDGQNFVFIKTITKIGGQNSYSHSVIGIPYDTEFWYRVAGYEEGGTYSAWTVAGSVSTLIQSPAPPTVNGPTNTTLNLSFVAPADNPATVRYGFYNMTSGSYLKEDGSATNQENYFLAAPNDPRWTNFKAIGLSPNTAYRFQVKAQGANTESWSSDSAAVRTLANPPSNAQATVNSATSITVNWAGDAVTFYNAKNTTTGVESGWRTGTAYTFANLTCNTSYNFTVQSRNSDNVAGAIVAVTATTAVCPAQPPPAAANPTLTSVSAAANSDTSIAVSWAGTASSYFIQNSTAVTNSGWISGNSYTFNNLVCNTTYNFTVQGRNSGGTLTATLSVTAQTKSCGSLFLLPTPTSTPAPTPPAPSPSPIVACTNLATGNSYLTAGTMFKVVGRPAIYVLGRDREVLYFPSGDEFKSWRPTYGGYILINQTCFDSLDVPSSYPAAINFRPGSFVLKRPAASQLYAVLPGNTLAKITPAAARALYGSFYKTMTVADIFWPHYVKRAADITTSQPHPGMLVSKGGITWYVNSDNTLSEVTAAGFAANEFQTQFVHPVSESMVSGLATGQIIGDKVSYLTNKTQSE